MTPEQLSRELKAAQDGYAARNPKSFAQFHTATKSLPGGGTRSSIFVDPFPLFVSKGKGSKLVDLDGHEYVDLVSDFTSGIYGKSDPLIKRTIVDALEDGIQLGAHTKAESNFASLIQKRFPSMELVRFANSGTEANLLAISTAIRFTGRRKVVVFEGGYHGSLLSHFQKNETAGAAQSNAALSVPYDFHVARYNDISELKLVFSEFSSEIAAVIVEPMLGAGGCIPGNPDFLHSIRKLCTESGTVLIFDEVQTARLSVGGRQKLLDLNPDITTLGKFFGGGFAFGCFGGRKDIMSLFDSRVEGAVSHGGTFNNSILTLKCGAVALEHLLTPQRLQLLNEKGDELRNNLNRLFSETSSPFEITGLGSINQLHCTMLGEQSRKGLDLLFFKLLEKGFWIAQRGLLALSFENNSEQLDEFVRAIEECLASCNF
ncbi:PLP-dependent transferase [Meredithblackwellia eburnea MCA 4105]